MGLILFCSISIISITVNCDQAFVQIPNRLSDNESDVIQHLANNTSAEKLIAKNGPKLLGIFADDVNGTENLSSIQLLSAKKFEDKQNFGQKEINETIALIENKRSVNKNENNFITESVLNNTIESSDQINNDVNYYTNKSLSDLKQNISFYTKSEPTLNLCEFYEFETNTTLIDTETPVCFLSADFNPPSGAQYSPGSGSGIGSGLLIENSIIPIYFRIPESSEKIDFKSYIAINASICSDPGGQVLIYDEASHHQLLSFENRGTSRMCNLWPIGDESFVSDSNKIRVEMVLPFGKEDEKTDHEYIKKPDNKIGKRIIHYKEFDLKITYSEIEFTQMVSTELNSMYDNNKTAQTDYTPNSVKTYILLSPESNDKKTEQVGIQIDLELLDFDMNCGDFVLIGPGSEPTHRELSKAQIISNKIVEGDEPTKVWVNADSAYIRLVTHNSLRKTGPVLRFSWLPPNNTVTITDDEKVPPRIKNAAIQICILDHGCQQMENSFKKRFIEELVHIANDYLINVEHDITTFVDNKQVLLFNHEEGVRIHQDITEIFCQTQLAIASSYDDQWPMVSHNTLNNMFFRGSDSKVLHSFGNIKVTDCSHLSISFWKMILPIIIILIVSLLLMLIAWRYQYTNWMRSQRSENAKYMKTQVNDANEDTLFSKGPKSNPIFQSDIESPINMRKTNTLNKTIESIDGNLISDKETADQSPEPIAFETFKKSSISSIINTEAMIDRNSWPIQNTSQRSEQQYNSLTNDRELDTNQDYDNRGAEISSVNSVERTMSTVSETLPLHTNQSSSITGLHGTQHESLRSYPRSALRRSRTISEDEYVVGPEFSAFKLSKVQFEIPKRSPLIGRDVNQSIGHENQGFVEV